MSDAKETFQNLRKRLVYPIPDVESLKDWLDEVTEAMKEFNVSQADWKEFKEVSPKFPPPAISVNGNFATGGTITELNSDEEIWKDFLKNGVEKVKEFLDRIIQKVS